MFSHCLCSELRPKKTYTELWLADSCGNRNETYSYLLVCWDGLIAQCTRITCSLFNRWLDLKKKKNFVWSTRLDDQTGGESIHVCEYEIIFSPLPAFLLQRRGPHNTRKKNKVLFLTAKKITRSTFLFRYSLLFFIHSSYRLTDQVGIK